MPLPSDLVFRKTEKGVLELRAWVQHNGTPLERAVSIIE